jgi:hypothetical protein
LTWGKGLYYHLNRTGKSLRKYPDGEDPLKQELFGKTRLCTRCNKRKSTLKFHWKTDYTNSNKVIKRLQRFCGVCRVKQDNDKYSASPDAYIRRRIQMLRQDCHRHRGRKKVQLSYDKFFKIWKTQFAKTGLTCPLSGETMTHQRGKGEVLTNISVDRIDSDKEYERGNIQFVCLMANLMKHKYNNKNLLSWSKKIVNNLEKNA